jgi:membrane-associated protein
MLDFSNLSELLNLETLVQTAGYLGLSAIVFAESGLFFGFFLPGDSLLFTAGFLASKGYLNVWLLAPLLSVCAIAGDAAGYWFGKKVGPMIFRRPDSFWFSQKRVEDARKFFEKYGARSLILARFIPAVRTFTPIIAGTAGMPYGRFTVYNVIGGILWAFSMTFAGYYLGTLIPGIDRYVLPIVGLIILVSLAPIALQWKEWYKGRQE